MPEPVDTPVAVHHQVVVDTDPVLAFDVLTSFGRWWPLGLRSVLGASATVGFVDGRLVERSTDGRTVVWGTVTRWIRGVSVALTWHPGRSAERAGRLEVTFAAAGAQTLVTLEHTGWDGYDDPHGARADYDRGWPRMLGFFRDEANAGPAEIV